MALAYGMPETRATRTWHAIVVQSLEGSYFGRKLSLCGGWRRADERISVGGSVVGARGN